MKLWFKMILGLVLGVGVGLLFGPAAAPLKLIGTLFLGLLSMLVVLLVFSSMTAGILSIRDPRKLGRVGLKAMLLYAFTTAIAIIIGLITAKVIQPGSGMHLVSSASGAGQPVDFSAMLTSMIPSNPIASFASGNVLQIIVFSLFFGVGVNLAGERGRPIRLAIEALAEVMYRVTHIVMRFAPFGVFGIMAWVAGTFGYAVLVPLAKFIATNYLACCLHMGLVFCGILLFVRFSPRQFFKGMREAIVMAFSTSSSSAALPMAMECAERNLEVPKNIAGFVMPLGATVNMNGTAIFHGITAVFIAQAYGIELSLTSLGLILVTATLSAMGAAGIPGGGLVTLSLVLSSVGLPLEGIALVAGIDRLRDAVSTVVNVVGDAVVAVCVARGEKRREEVRGENVTESRDTAA